MSTPPISQLLRASTPPPVPAAASSPSIAPSEAPAPAAASSSVMIADEQKGRRAEQAIESMLSDAQREILLKVFEEFQSPPISGAQAQNPDDSEKILEEALSTLDINERLREIQQQTEAQKAAMEQQITAYTNRTLESCNRFFQELLREPPANLKSWLETHRASKYHAYQVAGPFSPFHTAKTIKNQLDTDLNFRKGLNQSFVSTFTVIYTACVAKLKAFKLDSYLEEFPEELLKMDAIAVKFLSLPETFPQNAQELTDWFKGLTDQEKASLTQLYGMSSQSDTDPEKYNDMLPLNAQKCMSKINPFMERLQAKGLEQQFNDLMADAAMQMMMQQLPFLQQFLSLAGNPQQETPK